MSPQVNTLLQVKELLYKAEFAYRVYGDEATLSLLQSIRKAYASLIAEQRKLRQTVVNMQTASINSAKRSKIISIPVYSEAQFDAVLNLI